MRNSRAVCSAMLACGRIEVTEKAVKRHRVQAGRHRTRPTAKRVIELAAVRGYRHQPELPRAGKRNLDIAGGTHSVNAMVLGACLAGGSMVPLRMQPMSATRRRNCWELPKYFELGSVPIFMHKNLHELSLMMQCP